MASAVDIGTLITKRPEMHGGRPCIAGTGTTVLAIVGLYRQGLSAEEIQQQLPHLSLEGIFAALTYWSANLEEIEGYFREDRVAHDEWLAEVESRR